MANEMTIQDISNMSVAFAKSGFFGYKNSSEAFSLMCIAQANGLHPAKAAERYHIIQGRPAMKADAMLSCFQEAGGKVRWLRRAETECRLWLSHPQGGELEVCWTIERAKKAGLTDKSIWRQYPTQMLSARCVSEGVRAVFPACLCGMYTPEEVIDFGSPQQFQTSNDKTEQAEIEVTESFTTAPQDAPQQPQATPKVDETLERSNRLDKPKVEKKPIDDDTKKFLDGMSGLYAQNETIYNNVMDEFGFVSAMNVPPEKRTEVFCTIQAEITKHAQQQPKSGPTAQEQGQEYGGEVDNSLF